MAAKTYELKIPVFISEIVNQERGLFDLTHEHMITLLKQKIDKHSASGNSIVAPKRKKPKTKEIKALSYQEYNFNNIPTLFVRMNTADTNLYDTYIEREEKIELTKSDRIGSDNNWLLFYPYIRGVDPNKYTCCWLIFIYADPHKTFEDITQAAKVFVKRVLELKLKNIKTQDVLNELKEANATTKLEVRYTTVLNDFEDTEVKYQDYLISGRMKKRKEQIFNNMPFSLTEEIINDDSYQTEFQKKEINVFLGKKEFKILKREQLDEAKKQLEDLVEETFNMCTEITEIELEPKTLYNIDFMADKLKPVIENYLDSYA